MKQARRGRAAEPLMKLGLEEREARLQPVQRAFGRMREGVATTADWCTLASACNLAIAIENDGFVAGLREHLHSTNTALHEIRRRACDDAGPYPYALHLEEIERLRTFVDLYAHQLAEVSTASLARARQHVLPVRLEPAACIAAPAMLQEALPL